MKRHSIAVAVLAGALLLPALALAQGGGLTQTAVEARGWMCFPGEIMVHCVHPNTDIDALIAGELASVPSLNFSLANGTFLGTEILIRADLGSDDRPCRQGTETDGTYEAVDFGGASGPEYYSCHHNNDV